MSASRHHELPRSDGAQHPPRVLVHPLRAPACALVERRTRPRPFTKEQVEAASMLLRGHMLVHLDQARASTGRSLPGPLPATDVEPDPATGVTEQGAS